jgi:hypothetical protein
MIRGAFNHEPDSVRKVLKTACGPHFGFRDMGIQGNLSVMNREQSTEDNLTTIAAAPNQAEMQQEFVFAGIPPRGE